MESRARASPRTPTGAARRWLQLISKVEAAAHGPPGLRRGLTARYATLLRHSGMLWSSMMRSVP